MSNLNRIRGAYLLNESLSNIVSVPGASPAAGTVNHFPALLAGTPHMAMKDENGNVVFYSNQQPSLDSVINIQVDATLDPGASPTKGDAYILTNVGSLNANFGTITGVGNNDRVEYDGADFVITFDASARGKGFSVINKADDDLYLLDATTWVKSTGGITGISYGGDVVGSNAIIGAFAETTVGPTGKYTTFKAAIDAGKRSIMVIGNTTETANTVLSGDTYVYMTKGAQIGFGQYQIKLGANNRRLDVYGPGALQFDYSTSNVKALVDQEAFTGTQFNVDGAWFINDSASGTNLGICILETIKINIRNSGIFVSGNVNGLAFTQTGPDTLVENFFVVSTNANISATFEACQGVFREITFTGTFSNNPGGLQFLTVSDNILLDGIYNNSSGAIFISGGKISKNIMSKTGNPISFEGSTNSVLSDSNLSGGTLKIFSNMQVCNLTDAIIGTQIPAINGASLVSCKFTSSSPIVMSGAKFTACTFDSGFTVDGDNNSFDDCLVKTGTITVSATGNANKFNNVITATPLVSNGTNTIITNPETTITPAQITANTNDYNPAGFSNIKYGVMRASVDANRDVTGFVAQADGFKFTLVNVSTPDLKLKNNNVNSAAGNRILLNADLILKGNHSAELYYDGTSAAWRVIAEQTN